MNADTLSREERTTRLADLRAREAARKVVLRGKPLMEHPLLDRMTFAAFNPGAIVPRGDNYQEPLYRWQARAVQYVLDEVAQAPAEPITDLATAVEVMGALPMPAGPAAPKALTPAREQQIRTMEPAPPGLAGLGQAGSESEQRLYGRAAELHAANRELLAEIERLRGEVQQRVCDLIVTELPRRTGMRIDPNEHWDVQATKKALAGLDDAGIIIRRDWLLTSCAEMPKRHEAALYEYGLHLSRELTRRKITLTDGGVR